jgi:hypothetical protein
MHLLLSIVVVIGFAVVVVLGTLSVVGDLPALTNASATFLKRKNTP